MSKNDDVKNRYPVLVALVFFIYISATAFILIFSASIGSVMASERVMIGSLPNVTNLDVESDFVDVEISNDRIYSGYLILVNNSNPCRFDGENLVSVLERCNGKYKVSDYSIRLNEDVFNKTESMLSAFYDITGNGDTMINSAYRSKELQQELYDEDIIEKGYDYEGDSFVALPGCSEHQTGYAFDLSVMTDDGMFAVLDNEGEQSWILNNCDKYGFILRYPGDKVAITGIGYETWHYRYVGLPHSTYIMQNNLCLEEYIELMKQHTINNPLYTTDYTTTMWMVYYVPAGLGERTVLQVPRDSEYQICGNNCDGFIISVKMT